MPRATQPPQRIPGSGGRKIGDPRISGESLQPQTASFRARLLAACGVRSKSRLATKGGRCTAAIWMSFSGIGEIYQSDVSRGVRERRKLRPRPHRLDEFPAGYSSAGCSPTLPASASPAESHSALQLSFRSTFIHRTVSSALTACLSPGGHRTLFRYLDEQAFRYNNRKDESGEPLEDADRFDLAVRQI